MKILPRRLDDAWIAQRRPLWIALSELFLDTELMPTDRERIAQTIADSGLSLRELHEVYAREVAPVVAANLRTVAGVWSGFDETWLCAQIVRYLRNRSRWSRFMPEWAQVPGLGMTTPTNRIMKIALLIVIALALSLGYCVHGVQQAETLGKAWCNERINKFAGRETASTAEIYREVLPVSEKTSFLVKAEFTHQMNHIRCYFVVTDFIFPTSYHYDHETGQWEVLD